MMYTRKSGLCCRCRLYIMYIYMFIHIYIFIYTCIYIHVYLTGLPKYKVLRFAMRLPSLCMLSNQKSGLCCRCRLHIIYIYIYIHIYIHIYAGPAKNTRRCFLREHITLPTFTPKSAIITQKRTKFIQKRFLLTQ